MDAIEKEAANGNLDHDKEKDKFGKSVTKELLAQSRKEIANDLDKASSGSEKFGFNNTHEKK